MKKIMNYANKISVNNVVIVGEEEVETKTIKVKNMVTGEQRSLDIKGF